MIIAVHTLRLQCEIFGELAMHFLHYSLLGILPKPFEVAGNEA